MHPTFYIKLISSFLYPTTCFCHTLVAGYYGFILAVHLSLVTPSVCLSIHTSFLYDNISIYQQISFRFGICICTKNVMLRIVNGQILIISDRGMALVSVPFYVLI